MELRFAGPDMRQMAAARGEVLACCLFEDERPVQGIAGLIDWRLVARLSRHLETGALTGARGETAILPGKPRLPFEKIVLFGLGPKADFDENVFVDAVHRIIDTLSGLRVRMAVIERPGRHTNAVDAIHAIQVITEVCKDHGGQDAWTLLESAPDQKRIVQHLEEDRRRRRLR
jgi:hypothetical protein